MSDYSKMNDMELLQLLQQENRDAFAEIYNRYWKVLFFTANNIIQNQMEAQDAVQNVFITVWQRRKEVEIKSLKAFLQQATRFQVFKAIKAKKTDNQFLNRLAAITADIVYETPLLFKEQEALLAQMIATLPEDCRYIFKLSREEHLTYKQIAGQLNISEKTVEKKMSICLKHIRLALQQNFVFSMTLLIAYYFRFLNHFVQ